MKIRNKTYVLVSGLIFSIVGIVHALRIFNGWEASIGDWAVPMWLSWVAAILTLYLAFSSHRLAKRS